MADDLATLAHRMAAVEAAMTDVVRRDVHEARMDAARQEVERVRTAIEEVRDTLRWQSRVLVLWALGMIVTLGVGVSALVQG